MNLERSVVLTVSQLNEYVRGLLLGDPMLRSMRIRGEISNLKRYPSGHWYFTLKDGESRINCVMFRQYNQALSFLPRDGMAVILQGGVNIYVRDGAYQFYATDMRADGVGDLYARFLELKAKLEKEGLFDLNKKRPLPLLPRKVGVVTSSTGAVIHDILNVSGGRNPSIPILLHPVKVQGQEAAGEIATAIKALNKLPLVDVIIVGRGGGSLEDLWPFNEEIVARAIADSSVPVVSAVGHETDFTIADFAADVRAATPSQAAEFVFRDVHELQAGLNGLMLSMEKALQQKFLDLENRLRLMQTQLLRQSPQSQLAARERQSALLYSRLCSAMERQVEKVEGQLVALRGKRLALGPEQVLSRGYAMALQKGKPVTNAEKILNDESLEIVFHDGRVIASVKAIETKGVSGNAS